MDSPDACIFNILQALGVPSSRASVEKTIRVRPLTSQMRYVSLVRRKIIPDLEMYTKKLARIKYPDFIVKSKSYAQFGMFMDYVLRKYLSLSPKINANFGEDPSIEIPEMRKDVKIYETSNNFEEYLQASNVLSAKMLNERPYRKEDLLNNSSFIINACESMLSQWDERFGINLKYNVELSVKKVRGHPDITSDNVVWDIKCGCTQKQQRIDTYLQVLAYWAMSPESVKLVGVLFPLSMTYSLYDMSGWSKKMFLEEMIGVSECLLKNPYAAVVSMGNVMTPNNLFAMYPIGNHVTNDGFLKSVEAYIQTCFDAYGTVRPIQIYLRNNRGRTQSSRTVNDLVAVGELVKSYNIPIYTHGVLAMNLCSPDDYVSRVIIEDLVQTKKIGGKGVVVHLGKADLNHIEDEENTIPKKKAKTKLQQDNISLSQAFANQTANIRKCLPYCTVNCKIFLETPCGKDSEVCADLESFNNYLATSFTSEEKNFIGVCLDTCHVFVAGASPLAYMKYWMEHGAVGIGLVHFNDSKNCFGYCVDGHAFPGKGRIGLDEMTKIAEFCLEHGIDMIFE